MEQRRNSQPSLLSAIMGTPAPAASPKNLAAERAAASLRSGPQQPRGGTSYGRATRRARKARQRNRIEQVNKQTAQLKRKREQALDTAAAFARIWFAGPPTGAKKTGKSAFHRVAERVQKQADNLVETGRASDHADAIKQIEESMQESVRQLAALRAERDVNRLKAAKQVRIDPQTGHPVVG